MPSQQNFKQTLTPSLTDNELLFAHPPLKSRLSPLRSLYSPQRFQDVSQFRGKSVKSPKRLLTSPLNQQETLTASSRNVARVHSKNKDLCKHIKTSPVEMLLLYGNIRAKELFSEGHQLIFAKDDVQKVQVEYLELEKKIKEVVVDTDNYLFEKHEFIDKASFRRDCLEDRWFLVNGPSKVTNSRKFDGSCV